MKKKYFLLSLIPIIFFLHNCGYTPIYSSTNLNININQINYEKNDLNNQIGRTIRSLSDPDGVKTYDIKFNVNSNRRIVSKNSKGETEFYEIKIILDLSVYNENENYSKQFTDLLKYRNNENKFELKLYENEIKGQIVNNLIEEILVYFSELQ